jgi:hypothetical protein
MAEGVHGARQGWERSPPWSPTARRRCPSDTKASPGRTAPTPTAPAALSPAPPARIGAHRHAPAPCTSSGRKLPGRLRCPPQGAASGRGDRPAGRQRHIRPVTRADVQPQRARGVRHVFLDMLAGEPPAQVGLGQQHLGRARRRSRGSCFLHPQQLWCREARHGDVAGHLIEASGQSLLRARHIQVRLRPSFHRMQGRSTAVLRVEQRGAMHLSGEADPFHVSASCGGRFAVASSIQAAFQVAGPPGIGRSCSAVRRCAGRQTSQRLACRAR